MLKNPEVDAVDNAFRIKAPVIVRVEIQPIQGATFESGGSVRQCHEAELAGARAELTIEMGSIDFAVRS